MKNKLWAYMIKLSTNMWADEGGNWKYAPYEPVLKTDDKVWREVIDYLPSQGFNAVLIDVGDAIQYESHPEISVKGAWSKEKMKKELDHMRSIGLMPIPKLNFSAAHDAWLGIYGRMVSTPIYYEVCKDLILEVIELFDNPEYFHLGLDEENIEHQRGFSIATIRQRDLWWHDAYFFFDIVEKAGARPWVWADFCWAEPKKYLERMPKSVLQSNWAYDPIAKNADGTYKSIRYQTYVSLEEKGFDQVPTCSNWTCWYNTLETMQLSEKHIAPERLKGYLMAPWQFTYPGSLHSLLDGALRFGEAKREMYPEK